MNPATVRYTSIARGLTAQLGELQVIIKLLFKTACLGVIAIGGFAYFSWTQGKDPAAPFRDMSISKPQISLPSVPDLPEIPTIKLPTRKAQPSTFYQWTDENGGTQFSTSPPPAGFDYQTLKIDPNANVVPAHKTKTSRSDIATEPGKISASRLASKYTGNDNIQLQVDQVKALNANRIDNLNTLIGQQD